MFKNVASQKVYVYAYDSTTNAPKTGDAANITAYVAKDFGAATVLGDTSAAEVDATNAKGFYVFDLTQGESNADVILVSAKSSTANVVVLGAPATVFTFPATGILAPTTAGRTLDVTATGEAGIDWANIGSPTTTVSLSGTTVATVTTTGTASAVTALSSGAISEASYATTAGTFAPLGIIDQGTAQSATSTTLVLRSAAAFADNTLAGAVVAVLGSTQGYWQARAIKTNTLSDDTVNVDAWTVTPSGTITYRIFAAPPAPTTPPDVNVEQWNNVNVTGMPMPTYTQPTGFLSATFPAGTVANTTNITAGTITTVTNLTNAPTAGDLTATMKTSAQTAASAALTAYDAATTTGVANLTAPMIIPPTTVGATGNDTTHVHIPGSGLGDDEVNDHLLVIRDNSTGETHAHWVEDWVGATSLATVAALPFTPEAGTDVVRVLAMRRDVTLSAAGVDLVWDEAQSGHTNAGTFGKYLDAAVSGVSTGGVSAADIADAVLDEALSGHATAGTLGKAVADTLADTNELQTDWANNGRLDNILDARASQTSVDDVPTNAELTAALGTADDAVLAAIAALNNVSAAQVATAILAAGDVDGFTLEQTLKLCLAALAGKVSGAATTTVTIRAADDSKARLTATCDSDGNRTAVTLDAAG